MSARRRVRVSWPRNRYGYIRVRKLFNERAEIETSNCLSTSRRGKRKKRPRDAYHAPLILLRTTEHANSLVWNDLPNREGRLKFLFLLLPYHGVLVRGISINSGRVEFSTSGNG